MSSARSTRSARGSRSPRSSRPRSNLNIVERLSVQSEALVPPGEFRTIGAPALLETNEATAQGFYGQVRAAVQLDGYIYGPGCGNVLAMVEAFPRRPLGMVLVDVDPAVVCAGRMLVAAMARHPTAEDFVRDFFCGGREPLLALEKAVLASEPSALVRRTLEQQRDRLWQALAAWTADFTPAPERAAPLLERWLATWPPRGEVVPVPAFVVRSYRRLRALALRGAISVLCADVFDPRLIAAVAALPRFRSTSHLLYLSNVVDHVLRRELMAQARRKLGLVGGAEADGGATAAGSSAADGGAAAEGGAVAEGSATAGGGAAANGGAGKDFHSTAEFADHLNREVVARLAPLTASGGLTVDATARNGLQLRSHQGLPQYSAEDFSLDFRLDRMVVHFFASLASLGAAEAPETAASGGAETKTAIAAKARTADTAEMTATAETADTGDTAEAKATAEMPEAPQTPQAAQTSQTPEAPKTPQTPQVTQTSQTPETPEISEASETTAVETWRVAAHQRTTALKLQSAAVVGDEDAARHALDRLWQQLATAVRTAATPAGDLLGLFCLAELVHAVLMARRSIRVTALQPALVRLRGPLLPIARGLAASTAATAAPLLAAQAVELAGSLCDAGDLRHCGAELLELGLARLREQPRDEPSRSPALLAEDTLRLLLCDLHGPARPPVRAAVAAGVGELLAVLGSEGGLARLARSPQPARSQPAHSAPRPARSSSPQPTRSSPQPAPAQSSPQPARSSPPQLARSSLPQPARSSPPEPHAAVAAGSPAASVAAGYESYCCSEQAVFGNLRLLLLLHGLSAEEAGPIEAALQLDYLLRHRAAETMPDTHALLAGIGA